MNKIYQLIVDKPWVALSVCLLLCGTSLYGIQFIKYNNAPNVYFSDDNPDVQNYQDMQGRFNADNTIVFIVAPESGDVFNAETLGVIEELSLKAWEIPHSIRVDSLSTYQHTEVDEDFLETDYLYRDGFSLTQDEAQKIRKISLNERSLVKSSISEDGTVAVIFATVLMDETQSEAVEIMTASHKIADEFKLKYPDINIYLTGEAAFSEATEIATKQAANLTLIALLAIFICLQFFLRSLIGNVITLIIVILSIATTLGITGWLGILLTPIAGLSPAMILTLAVADCVHIFISYQQSSSLGKPPRAAMLESLRVNFLPVWLTSITTAVGFLMLNFAESGPFHALGNIVAIGVLVAFLLSVFMLPALVMLLPKTKFKAKEKQSPLMESLAIWIIAHYKKLLLGVGASVAVLIACIPTNEINDVFHEYFDESFAVRIANDFYMENVGGMARLAYTVPSLEESGINEPEYLLYLDQLVTKVEALPSVSHTRSYIDIIKRLNRDMHGGDAAFYKVPDNRELAAQYMLMYEMSLPQGLGLENQVDISKSSTKLMILIDQPTSERVLQIKDTVDEYIHDELPPYMHSKGTSLDSLFARISFTNIKQMLIGTAAALVLVSLLLIVALRSVRYGLLSLLPNILPAAVAFGLWGLLVGEIGLVVSIVACMTLGIVVDDTVHFLSKYVRYKRENKLSTEEAIRYAFSTVGVALISTSVVLMINFSIIGTSHFYPNSSMGVLAAITIGMALIVDFFLFVPLLVWLDRTKRKPDQRSEDVASTHSEPVETALLN